MIKDLYTSRETVSNATLATLLGNELHIFLVIRKIIKIFKFTNDNVAVFCYC